MKTKTEIPTNGHSSYLHATKFTSKKVQHGQSITKRMSQQETNANAQVQDV
jgi:hypothetical protein